MKARRFLAAAVVAFSCRGLRAQNGPSAAAAPNPAGAAGTEARPAAPSSGNAKADPIGDIVAELKADPAKLDVVGQRLVDFIWTMHSGGLSFIGAKTREDDLNLEPGKRARDRDQAAVRKWVEAGTRDAAVLYYALREDDPARARLIRAMSRWGGKTQETFSLAADRAPDGKARDAAVGPRSGAGAAVWLAAFLADAVRQSRRILSIGELHPGGAESIRPRREKVAPGTIKRWRIRRRPEAAAASGP